MTSPDIDMMSNNHGNLLLINNQDVNRIFGWAIHKQRKVYVKLIKAGHMNGVYDEKLAILNNMKKVITDVIEDANYIKLYVSKYDLIRNEGYLTLINPIYVREFALLLTDITRETRYDEALDKIIFPNKDNIQKSIFEKKRKRTIKS